MTRFNIQWTAKTLTNQMNKGKVNFDNAVQRGLVWDNGKKSLPFTVCFMVMPFPLCTLHGMKTECMTVWTESSAAMPLVDF